MRKRKEAKDDANIILSIECGAKRKSVHDCSATLVCFHDDHVYIPN